VRTYGHHPATCRGLSIQLIELVFQFARELRSRPMPSFIVHDVIHVDRIGHHNERLIPLRERREDIPLLVEYFIDRFARKAGKKIRRVNKKTLDLLQSYPWPGNIRELQNVIERSVIVCEGEDFSVDERWLSRQPVATELRGQIELSQRLAAHEKEAIEAALSESGGRVFGPSGAAAKLGIPRSTLESKIRSLKINKNRFKVADPSNDN
jgi:DNA-binding NtrC family response regulator